MTDRWQPSERYPDPAIVALDPSFKQYHLALSAVERLWTGSRWGEGPVWLGDTRCLLWSDIPNNRVLKWDETTGTVSEWQKPSNNANGHTRDRQGRIIACEHAGRRIVRFEYDGSTTVLADSYQGKRLNSPNDVICKSDGSIWFTDPPYGIQTDYEGGKQTQELPARVYRLDVESGDLTVVADDMQGPNGLCFSPDESLLYVSETGLQFAAEPVQHIRVYEVQDGRALAAGRHGAHRRGGALQLRRVGARVAAGDRALGRCAVP